MRFEIILFIFVFIAPFLAPFFFRTHLYKIYPEKDGKGLYIISYKWTGFNEYDGGNPCTVYHNFIEFESGKKHMLKEWYEIDKINLCIDEFAKNGLNLRIKENESYKLKEPVTDLSYAGGTVFVIKRGRLFCKGTRLQCELKNKTKWIHYV